MAECTIVDTTITFCMSDRCGLDHFLDRLEEDKLRRLGDSMPGENIFKEFIRRTTIDDLDERMRALVFPWRLTDKIAMTGYDAEPDIDQHYFALVAETTREDIDDAGIHDDTVLGSITGKDLRTVVFLITSFYLKHIRFVDVAKQTYPEINVAMSLTIWKPLDELVHSITSFGGMDEKTVLTAIDLLTVKPGHESYFESEVTPYFPMLIKITDTYLLEPITSIFRNPFHGIRMLHEATDAKAAVNLLAHRERWMAYELYSLFKVVGISAWKEPPTCAAAGKSSTDIDAAVFDVTTRRVGFVSTEMAGLQYK